MATEPTTSAGEVSTAAASASPVEKDGSDKDASRSGSGSASAVGSDEVKEIGIPVRTKESFQKLMIDRYTTRDALAAAVLNDQQKHTTEKMTRMRDKLHDYKSLRQEYRQWFPPGRLYGDGYNGFGNGYTENHAPSRIVYPQQKMRPGRKQTPALKYKRKDMLKQAEQHEELVPLRLEVEWDKVRLRDTFTWNLHERLVHVELFASQLVEDMGLKPPASQPVYDQVVHQMRDQLNDFYPLVYSEEDSLDPELPYSAYKNDEMRILVKLNITIGQHTLVDQFEWEINNPSNSPEDFATQMARDLSLSGEFTTAIAHCIREQSQLFTRSLYSIGHPFDGRPVEDPDLTSAFLQTPLQTVFRPMQQAKDYAPYLYELTDADLERNETILSREQRRQKRSINRRGGPQLPDLKERQRTIRTLIVSSTLPGAADNPEESRLYKMSKQKKRAIRDGDLSESDDSDDSAPDSPAPTSFLAQGTARTRGMRGAASAAAQRMANLGRSETPDASGIMHHHETRTSRRFRDETEEPQHMYVTVKCNKDKLRRVMRGDYVFAPEPQAPRPPTASTPSRAMPPPSTPSASTPQPANTGSGGTAGFPAGQIGRLPAPPVALGQPAPPAVSTNTSTLRLRPKH